MVDNLLGSQTLSEPVKDYGDVNPGPANTGLSPQTSGSITTLHRSCCSAMPFSYLIVIISYEPTSQTGVAKPVLLLLCCNSFRV